MSKNKQARNERIRKRYEPQRQESKAMATVLNKPFQNYASIVIKEIERLQWQARIFGANSIPNLESLKKFFDENKHPLETAKHYFESWH